MMTTGSSAALGSREQSSWNCAQSCSRPWSATQRGAMRCLHTGADHTGVPIATGAFQRELAHRSGLCQSTLSRAMPAVWDGIIHMSAISNAAEQVNMKAQCVAGAGFPDVIGAINCSHIDIKAPSHDEFELILSADCVPVLKKYVQEGKTFDYVINELTEIPSSRLSREEQAAKWEFLRLTLDMSMKVLRPSGKYLTHGDGFNKPFHLYEEELEKLPCPVAFSKEVATVPSYLEQWVFLSVWKK